MIGNNTKRIGMPKRDWGLASCIPPASVLRRLDREQRATLLLILKAVREGRRPVGGVKRWEKLFDEEPLGTPHQCKQGQRRINRCVSDER